MAEAVNQRARLDLRIGERVLQRPQAELIGVELRQSAVARMPDADDRRHCAHEISSRILGRQHPAFRRACPALLRQR